MTQPFVKLRKLLSKDRVYAATSPHQAKDPGITEGVKLASATRKVSGVAGTWQTLTYTLLVGVHTSTAVIENNVKVP